MILSFRTVADAVAYAAQHNPFKAAVGAPMPADYATRYGRLAYDTAVRCRWAARYGDEHRLHLGCIALSLSVSPPVARRQ